MKVEDIRNQFASDLNYKKFKTDKNGGKVLEIIGITFIADSNRIFGKINENYIQRELQWYISKSLNVNDIPEPIPEIWKQVASKNGEINSNYGWAIWSEENGSQYNNVLNTLKNDIGSRRACMIYNRPSMHTDYNRDGMSDFMCTNAVTYNATIHDTITFPRIELNATVQMRSNDAVFGYKNDFAWQKQILENLVMDLKETYPNITVGNIFWNAASLHIYERHFYLVKYYLDNFLNGKQELNDVLDISLEDIKKLHYIN